MNNPLTFYVKCQITYFVIELIKLVIKALQSNTNIFSCVSNWIKWNGELIEGATCEINQPKKVIVFLVVNVWLDLNVNGACMGCTVELICLCKLWLLISHLLLICLLTFGGKVMNSDFAG